MAGVSSRLSWLGIAREIMPGSAALPVAAVPVDQGSYEPEDTPQFLLDTGVRASMGQVAGAVPGVLGSALAFGGSFYPDSGGWWLDNLLGDTSTVSNGTLGTPQPLAAPVSAGATQLTVSSPLGTGTSPYGSGPYGGGPYGGGTGTVTTGSVIQISDGAASEVVIASQYSTGLVINCAGTPCRFAHSTNATVALETATGGYTHTFATLNAGTGQPPAHILTDTTGLTAGTGARAYPGVVVTQLDLAGNPGQGWVTGKITGAGWLSVPSAATVAYPATAYVAPFGGWQSVVTVNGTLAYAGPWAVSFKRTVTVYRSAQNPQNPQNIARGPLVVTGTLGYPDVPNETPLANMLTGGLMPVSISLSNGLTGAAALGMTVTCSAAQFTRAKLDHAALALGYGTAFQATDNSTDNGGSGGVSPASVTLVNQVAAY